MSIYFFLIKNVAKLLSHLILAQSTPPASLHNDYLKRVCIFFVMAVNYQSRRRQATYIKTHFSVSSPSWFRYQEVVWYGASSMNLQSGYFLL